MSSEFEMPEVCRGDIVLFAFSRHSADWKPMFVTDVYATNISGTMTGELVRLGTADFRENVVHIDDPRLDDPGFVSRQTDEGNQGVFQLSPTRLRLEARMALLEERMAQLTANKGRKAEAASA